MLTPLFFGDQKLTHDAICTFGHQVRWWISHFMFIWKLKRIIKIQNLNGDDRTINRGWDLSGHSLAVLNCVKFRVRCNRKKGRVLYPKLPILIRIASILEKTQFRPLILNDRHAASHVKQQAVHTNENTELCSIRAHQRQSAHPPRQRGR